MRLINSCATFCLSITKGTTIHTIQLLLVEADNAEQAFSIVSDKLSDGEPRWSDWHEAGGNPSHLNFAGRWSGEIFMTPEQKQRAENKLEVDLSENPNHLCFSDDPVLADSVITTFIGYRINEIEAIRKTLRTDYAGIDVFTYPYNPDKNDYKKSMVMYYIKKLSLLLSNEWCSETAIYDLENWDASLEYFYKRVQETPQRQFLIPVDFHH